MCRARIIVYPDCNRTDMTTHGKSLWAVVKQRISPLAVFQMNCLRRVCGISLRNQVLNVDMLHGRNTFSVESQLEGKVARSYFSGCLMIDCLRSFCLVKSTTFVYLAALDSAYIALCDCQHCCISRPYRDAQDRLLWRDKTCPACT